MASASKYNKKFEEQISFFIDKANWAMINSKKLAIYNLFADIVDRTPIWFTGTPISGNAKWNWTIEIGNYNPRVLKGGDSKNGTATKKRGMAVLEKMAAGDDVYIHNSAPQIMVLENGGYVPNPTLGSRNPETGQYEIRSVGGYSKQAPTGIVKVQMLKWNTYVNNAAKVSYK